MGGPDDRPGRELRGGDGAERAARRLAADAVPVEGDRPAGAGGGIRACLAETGFGAVGLGTISAVVGAAGERALDWFARLGGPAAARGLALDEIYGNQRRGGYLSAVDAESGLVWAAAGPVAVDHESWTLVLWDLEGRGVRWSRTVADGGGAIGRACRAVDPGGAHARDVWHVLHRCGQAQGR